MCDVIVLLLHIVRRRRKRQHAPIYLARPIFTLQTNLRTEKRPPGSLSNPAQQQGRQRDDTAMTPRLYFYGISPAATVSTGNSLSSALCGVPPLGIFWRALQNTFFSKGGGRGVLDPQCVRMSLWGTLHLCTMGSREATCGS